MTTLSSVEFIVITAAVHVRTATIYECGIQVIIICIQPCTTLYNLVQPCIQPCTTLYTTLYNLVYKVVTVSNYILVTTLSQPGVQPCNHLVNKVATRLSFSCGHTVYCNWMIVSKTIAIFGSCFQNNSYNSFLYKFILLYYYYINSSL